MKCQKSEMVGFSGPQAAVASSSSRGQQNILAEGRQGSRAVRAAERQGSRAVWTAEATGWWLQSSNGTAVFQRMHTLVFQKYSSSWKGNIPKLSERSYNVQLSSWAVVCVVHYTWVDLHLNTSLTQTMFSQTNRIARKGGKLNASENTF